MNVEVALRGLSFAALHIFRPSFIMGERSENRRGEHVGIALARAASVTMFGPLRRYRPIRAEDLAKAMVNIASLGAAGPHIYEYNEIVSFAR